MTAGDGTDARRRLEAENARLRAQLDTVEQYTAQTLVRATRLAQVISVLGHDIELDTLVERTATEIAELFAADITLFMLGPDGALTVEGQWGLRPDDLPDGPFAAPALPGLSTAEPVLIGPAGVLPVPPWLSVYRPRHVAWARLSSGDKSQGLMLLIRRAREPYDESEQRELRAIATRIAIAIENGLLHRRMRRQLDRGQRLQRLMTELAGILELDDIATRLSEILVEEVPVTASVIQIERDGELVPLVGTHVRPPTGHSWTQFPLEAAGKRVGRVDIAGAPPRDSGGYALMQHLLGLAAITLDKGLIYAQSQQQARHDSLTGLLSHRVFHEMLERLTVTPDTFSVVLIDIDDFKQINDLHGHQAGDEALREVASALRQGLRVGDSVFRIGGEEFCVVLPGLTDHDAYVAAERLRIAVAEIAAPLPVTISLGVASCPVHATNRDDLISRADAALYASKRSGKNRTTVAGTGTMPGPLPAPRGETPAEASWLLGWLNDKEPGSADRADAVAAMATEVGRLVGIGAEQLGHLRIAALLHDVGNVGVPDAILHKPGPLDGHEWDIVRTHPVVGAELLRGRDLAIPARYVLEHHERRDGTGYPSGLRADQIAQESQVLHVSSAYVAMTCDRADRAALAHDAAVTELLRLAGDAIDFTIVDAAVHVANQRHASWHRSTSHAGT
jgi:diguanylate cyclase (GGDEF)-like protein